MKVVYYLLTSRAQKYYNRLKGASGLVSSCCPAGPSFQNTVISIALLEELFLCSCEFMLNTWCKGRGQEAYALSLVQNTLTREKKKRQRKLPESGLAGSVQTEVTFK